MSCKLGMCQMQWTTSHYVFCLHQLQLPIMICKHIHHEWCYFSWRIYFPCRKRWCYDIKVVNIFIFGDLAASDETFKMKKSIVWAMFTVWYLLLHNFILKSILNEPISLDHSSWSNTLYYNFKNILMNIFALIQ